MGGRVGFTGSAWHLQMRYLCAEREEVERLAYGEEKVRASEQARGGEGAHPSAHTSMYEHEKNRESKSEHKQAKRERSSRPWADLRKGISRRRRSLILTPASSSTSTSSFTRIRPMMFCSMAGGGVHCRLSDSVGICHA